MRAEIKAAFVGPSIGTGSAIKRLEAALMPGEQVRAVAVCTYSDGSGVIVVTDRRVSLVSNVPTRESMVDFGLEQISTVSPKSGVLSGGLVITAAGRTEKVSIKKKSADAVARAVREAIDAAKNTSAPPAGSVGEELERLAGLLDRGLITREEFDAQRTQLLH